MIEYGLTVNKLRKSGYVFVPIPAKLLRATVSIVMCVSYPKTEKEVQETTGKAGGGSYVEQNQCRSMGTSYNEQKKVANSK